MHRHHHHPDDDHQDHGAAARRDHDEAHLLEAAFIEGFRAAGDKAAFLGLTGVPRALSGPEGAALKLVGIRLAEHFEVGAVAPGFATSELVYHPLPGAMVQQTTELRFVYRSLHETRELTWFDIMPPR